MRLFIDECLSPAFALWLNETGVHDAVHPLHVGRRGEPDHRVLARCLDEGRAIVTQNGRDFRKLIGRIARHPGLIILPTVAKADAWRLLQRALASLEAGGEPAEGMVNHVLEVNARGVISLTRLPQT